MTRGNDGSEESAEGTEGTEGTEGAEGTEGTRGDEGRAADRRDGDSRSDVALLAGGIASVTTPIASDQGDAAAEGLAAAAAREERERESEGADAAKAAAPASSPRSPRGKGKRAMSRKQKDDRNRKLADKRRADRELKNAREAAIKAASAAAAAAKGETPAPTPAATIAPDAAAAPAATRESEARLDNEQLAVLVGLGLYAAAKMIPPAWGGGDLTEQERAILGGVWAEPLRPYLSGEGGPWMIAAVTTIQVLAVRAIAHRQRSASPEGVTSAAAAGNGSPQSGNASAAAAAAPAMGVTSPGDDFDRDKPKGPIRQAPRKPRDYDKE